MDTSNESIHVVNALNIFQTIKKHELAAERAEIQLIEVLRRMPAEQIGRYLELSVELEDELDKKEQQRPERRRYENLMKSIRKAIKEM